MCLHSGQANPHVGTTPVAPWSGAQNAVGAWGALRAEFSDASLIDQLVDDVGLQRVGQGGLGTEGLTLLDESLGRPRSWP